MAGRVLVVDFPVVPASVPAPAPTPAAAAVAVNFSGGSELLAAPVGFWSK